MRRAFLTALTIAMVGFATTIAVPFGAPAQSPTTSRPAPASATNTYGPPRTPWGHPDLQGIYSNDDETGTPMARPAQFAGRTLDSITPEEMKTINRQRNEQFNAGVAGTEFAGGLRP